MTLLSGYPSPEDLDRFWGRAVSEVPRSPKPAERRPVYRPELGGVHDFHVEPEWLRFEGVDSVPFWCIWQRSVNRGRSKVLIHLPGYGSEVSLHPSLCHQGYHVLHVNPRGYQTPDGPGGAMWRLPDGTPDVLIHELANPDCYGYRAWVQDGLIALRWLLEQMGPAPAETGVAGDKVGIYGTSQGGGGALLLASVARFMGPVVGAVAADEPFLTGFHLVHGREDAGAYRMAFEVLDRERDSETRARIIRSLGLVDTHSHAPHMDFPVLLTAGDADRACPSDTIHWLYDRLPSSRSITTYAGEAHGYTSGFLRLAEAWFSLFL